jgi:hypothetical protein
MTPERWRQITELFHAARGRDPVQGDALLADACRDDPALQREVRLGTFARLDLNAPCSSWRRHSRPARRCRACFEA